MARDYLKKSIEKETSRAGLLLVATLMGGVLIVNSLVAQWMFPGTEEAGSLPNPHSATLALLGALLLGAPLMGHAVKHLIKGDGHMDQVVAIAVAAAIAVGQYQEAGVIAFFVVLSNLIETRTALGARASIESLIRITPTRAHRLLADDQEEIIEAKDLRPGDIVRVRPGDNVPADGEIVKGDTTILFGTNPAKGVG